MPGTGKIRFGAFELDTRAGEIRKGGRRVRLQDKPLRLLIALIEHRGDVVTREELRERLWPGNVVVEFDNGLNNAVNKLRAALGDSPEEPRYIETVGRRGYRFIGELGTDQAAGVAAPTPVRPSAPRARWLWASAALLPAVAAGVLLLSQRSGARPEVGSLAVLPLENLSSDRDQEYFSDGMTDTLISQLANIRSLRIISRQSVMRYKRSSASMPEIAYELGVDAVIEGTVQRTGDRVRVAVQLIHTPSDRHLWNAQYERPLGDVFAMQSEIARSVANEVEAVVTPQETARLAATPSVDPEAYDLFLRGRFF